MCLDTKIDLKLGRCLEEKVGDVQILLSLFFLFDETSIT